jgi:nucleotide-binding universal stress UspA family protein
MKKILVPTDFSDAALDAMRTAVNIAKVHSSTVYLLHVMYPNQGLDNNVYEVFWDTYSHDREEALKSIAHSFRDHPEFGDVPIVTAVEVGFPVETIRSYAQKERIELIVMGSTGSSDLEATLFGSNTISVALHCDIPMLAVPRLSKIRPHADFAFATDLEIALNDSSKTALKAVLSTHHNPLKVVHVVTGPDDKFELAKEADLHRTLRDVEHDMHYLHDSSVSNAVNNFVETIDATGLVVVSHHHGFWHKLFFNSDTKSLLKKVKLPVLVLHG